MKIFPYSSEINSMRKIIFFLYEKRKKKSWKFFKNQALPGWLGIWKCSLKNVYTSIENINTFILKIAKILNSIADFCNAQINVVIRSKYFPDKY